MKHLFLILLSVLLSSSHIYAQETETKMSFPAEVMLSLNRTTPSYGEQGRFGFGIGAYSVLFSQKRCNLILGLEYNKNNLFVEYINTNGKWGGGNYNTTYSINNIGIPVCFRVNMGKKVIFFIEAGAFFDFAIWGKGDGTYKLVRYNLDSTITRIEKPFNDKVSYKAPNVGIQGGVGLRIPVQKHEILIKGDYKWGIRKLIDSYSTYIHNSYWRFSAGFRANF
ncbi:PorT family protein [Bacteroidales bacterium OttesenSCG-928-C03]|nr:PorT family protein [Bacteroidales bacterium OttesenSCG-928-E04]MDL2307971.1 PorT family protein [Bacteroidales bacterium OttesenSCG-928-C03]MDL2325761.1 PorT family protein [Bacteroidales bacterium OttesenSCG-928-A14]